MYLIKIKLRQFIILILKKLILSDTKTDFIINVGRFRKQKNQILLIRAFHKFLKKNKNFKLVLVGDGILKKKIENEISNLNLNKNVILKGWVNNPLKYIRKSKLFVLTSLYEGLGNVLIDAVNHDVPCISTSCKSGLQEILLDGKGGYILKKNMLPNFLIQCLIV